MPRGATEPDRSAALAMLPMGRAEPQDAVAFLERHDLEGAILTVGGWAFARRSRLARITLSYEAATYTDRVTATAGLPRLDVGDRLGPAAASSGFVATGLVVVEPGALFIDLHDDVGGTYRTFLGAYQPLATTGAPEWIPAGAMPGRPIGAEGGFHPSASFARLAACRHAAQTVRACRAAPAASLSAHPVSILVSIFQGAGFLPAFFAGLRETTSGYDEIILVDNGNTDAALSARIATEAARIPRCRVIRLAENEGYIRGIGAAFAARTARGHVVVLNSDIELPPGWLPRLLWPLDNLPRVASATPFTNAGASCGFPLVDVDNSAFLGLDVATIDSAFQAVDPSRMMVSLPSGIGFCMAMHANAVAAVGWFDAETFGLGYGEENDWCQRARALGWRDVLVPNLFVYHKHGGVYPAETKRALLRANLATISRLHPCYFETVAAYFRTDPTAALRAMMAFRLAREASGARARVITLHLGDDPTDAMAALATGDALILALFDTDRRTWSALLSAGGQRSQVWGWGARELTALCDLLAPAAVEARPPPRVRALEPA